MQAGADRKRQGAATRDAVTRLSGSRSFDAEVCEIVDVRLRFEDAWYYRVSDRKCSLHDDPVVLCLSFIAKLYDCGESDQSMSTNRHLACNLFAVPSIQSIDDLFPPPGQSKNAPDPEPSPPYPPSVFPSSLRVLQSDSSPQGCHQDSALCYPIGFSFCSPPSTP